MGEVDRLRRELDVALATGDRLRAGAAAAALSRLLNDG
jgi:hypothetical protein